MVKEKVLFRSAMFTVNTVIIILVEYTVGLIMKYKSCVGQQRLIYLIRNYYTLSNSLAVDVKQLINTHSKHWSLTVCGN